MDPQDSADFQLLARMGRVYDFIQDHLAEELPVGRLAEVAILSPWHFQRVFQTFSGESPAAFVRRLRIERAANSLVLQRQSTVEAVASDCGFGSAELLARHFRRRFGVSPSGWRSLPPEERYRPNYQEIGPLQGRVSDLVLERRSATTVIYTRHFQGYDRGIQVAYQRLRHWAQPRGLVGTQTPAIGVGLDNPWVTSPDRCRYLACFPVAEFPAELGEGIGTKTLPGGLYAVVDYHGPEGGLARAIHEVYRVLMPRAGLEASDDVNYLEHSPGHPEPDGGGAYRFRLALPVRSL